MTLTHIAYIDDSGTKEYGEGSQEYSIRGKSRHFIFGAILLNVQEASLLAKKIIDLKLSVFKDDSVEIKSTWLRFKQERGNRYLIPYELNEDELRNFVDDYYDIVISSRLVMLASVIDKIHMQEDYANPWYPPAIAYEILLQRIEVALDKNSSASVTIDDMTGKTPKGNEYKINLKQHHKKMIQHGSQLYSGFTFDKIYKRLKFVNSAHSHLVQVADIISYNVLRQFRDYGGEWETEGLESLPMYDHFKRISHKFRSNSEGRVQGYGIVKFPIRNPVHWSIKKN